MSENFEKSYVDAGRSVEVLISVGFGAGWSTWNGYGIRLAADNRLIDFFKLHLKEDGWFDDKVTDDELIEFFNSIGFDGYLYYGGFRDCKIIWVPAGVPFQIREYDGAESIMFYDPEEWFEL